MDGAVNEGESTDEVEFPKASTVPALASVTNATTPIIRAMAMTQSIGLKLEHFAERLLEIILSSCCPPWFSDKPRLTTKRKEFRDLIQLLSVVLLTFSMLEVPASLKIGSGHLESRLCPRTS